MMLMLRLLRIVTPSAIFVLYALWSFMAMAATPRTESVVTGESITLGDVFEDAGPAASRVVMAAPAAGRSVVLDNVSLARLARSNGIAWRSASGNEFVKIERASQRFDSAVIGDAVARSLTLPAAAIGQTRAQLDNPQMVLHAPLGAPADLGFSSLSLSADGQRFAGLAQVKVGERIVAQSAISGRVVTSIDVPVLTRPIRRSEIIGANDITWQPTELAAGNSNILFNAEDIIGKSPRTGLRPGTPVRMSDLVALPAVTRGKQVSMIYQAGRMTITAQGRALNDAVVGQTVRVVNLSSSRTLEGIAEAEGVVRIGPPAPRTTAQAVSAPSNIRAN